MTAPSIGFLAKKYFVKGIRFKMSPLLNVKDDGWFQWTNILQITIRHSALALVSSFREMLLKSSWKPQKQPTIFAFQMYTWPVSYVWSRSYQIHLKKLQDRSVFYHYKWLELKDRWFQIIEHLKVFSFRNSRNHRSPSRPKSNQMKIQSQSQLQVKLSSPTPASLNLTSQKTAI